MGSNWDIQSVDVSVNAGLAGPVPYGGAGVNVHIGPTNSQAAAPDKVLDNDQMWTGAPPSIMSGAADRAVCNLIRIPSDWRDGDTPRIVLFQLGYPVSTASASISDVANSKPGAIIVYPGAPEIDKPISRDLVPQRGLAFLSTILAEVLKLDPVVVENAIQILSLVYKKFKKTKPPVQERDFPLNDWRAEQAAARLPPTWGVALYQGEFVAFESTTNELRFLIARVPPEYVRGNLEKLRTTFDTLSGPGGTSSFVGISARRSDGQLPVDAQVIYRPAPTAIVPRGPSGGGTDVAPRRPDRGRGDEYPDWSGPPIGRRPDFGIPSDPSGPCGRSTIDLTGWELVERFLDLLGVTKLPARRRDLLVHYMAIVQARVDLCQVIEIYTVKAKS